jgi:galactose oxidase
LEVSDTDEEGAASLPAAPANDPAFSEHLFETGNRGSVEINVGGRVLRARRNRGIPCTPATPGPALLTTTPQSAGEWSAPFDWPVVAVHLHLLSSGSVLSWGNDGDPQLWNPATGVFTSVPSPVELFCAGHAQLTNGRLLVAGGQITDNHGLPDITIFNGKNRRWATSAPMQRGRWYPTATTMSKGEAVITAGRDENGLNVNLPEVWTSGSVRLLTGASQYLPYYPRAFLAPNGKLFYAGEEQNTRYLDITGTGSWSTVGPRLYGERDYGSAVMYDEGRILYAGGGHTTNTLRPSISPRRPRRGTGPDPWPTLAGT